MYARCSIPATNLIAATVPKIETPKDDRERALARMIGEFPTLVDELRGHRWGFIPAVNHHRRYPVVARQVDESAVAYKSRGPRARTRRSPDRCRESEHLIAHTEPELVIDAVKAILATQR